MGRRRRRRREPEYLWWVVFTGCMAAAWFLRSWRLGLIALLIWCLYEFSLIPTVCRVMPREGFSCRNPVRGRLFACSPAHQELKNDALWRMVGLRNPLREKAAPDPNRDTGVVVYSPVIRSRLAHSDQAMLVLALGGTIVTLVGTLLGLMLK